MLVKFKKINNSVHRLGALMDRHYVLALVAICCAALLLRCYSWWVDPAISRDGARYLLYAASKSNIYGGSWYVPPLFLKLLGYLEPAHIEAQFILLNIMIGSLLPCIAFGITVEICSDRRVGLIAALFLAIHPDMVILSHQIQREIIYLFWGALSMLFLLKCIRTSSWRDMLIAVFFAVLSLEFRFEGFELLLFAAIAAYSIVNVSVWKKLALFGVFLLGAVVMTVAINLLLGISWQYYRIILDHVI